MKKLFLFFPLIIAFSFAYSTVINVDNDPNRPSGYYSNLQLAINNAAIGDTIYLYPSNTDYGNITITKRIHIFGAGYNGNSSGFISEIYNITLDTATSPASNPSGSSFQGLTILQLSCSKPNISNIIITGNYLNYSNSNVVTLRYNCSGWLITNNLINGYLNLYNNGAIIISNNIFRGLYSSTPIRESSSPSVIISHNLFFYFEYLYDVYNTMITDNIFICNDEYTGSYMAHNIFNNNLSYRDGATNDYDLPPSRNSGTSNLSNTNPLFVDGNITGYFDLTKDYHLQSSSPAKAAATDGTEIGPYGGSNPFVWGGAFTIPKIIMTNITNPVINQATPINVNIKAKKAEL